MALRSFPNRYLFSLYSKVTSLFSIRYILEIILACKRIAFRVEDIVFLLRNKSYSRIQKDGF